MVYYFENTTEYLWFKLDITGNNGVDDFGLDILQLAELSVAVEDSQEDTRILVDTATIQEQHERVGGEAVRRQYKYKISDQEFVGRSDLCFDRRKGNQYLYNDLHDRLGVEIPDRMDLLRVCGRYRLGGAGPAFGRGRCGHFRGGLLYF